MTLDELIQDLEKAKEKYGGDIELIRDTESHVFEDVDLDISPCIGIRSGSGGWKVMIEKYTLDNPNFLEISI